MSGKLWNQKVIPSVHDSAALSAKGKAFKQVPGLDATLNHDILPWQGG